MRKNLILLCLMAIVSFGVQAQVKSSKGLVVTSNGAVAYSLPRTTLKVTVEVEKESIRKGPYARYAQKYLGVMAPLADKDIYTITGGKIGFAEEADPEQVYTVENPDKSSVKIYESTREGFMAAQMEGATPVPSAFRPTPPAQHPMRDNIEAVSLVNSDTSFVKVQVDRRSTVEQNPESAALDAANMIYTLRKKRMELVTGDAGENVFGDGFKAALDELNRLEEEYTALFLGKQFKQKIVREYDVIPEEGKSSAIVCRFSDTGGLLPSSDLSGRLILIEMTPEQKAQNSALTRRSKDSRGTVFYRIADVVDCRLTDGKREIAQRRVPIYQFGEVVEVPVNMLK